jgi:murein DD-endopeptidase MepM/ murein hydrolase activator NlpD
MAKNKHKKNKNNNLAGLLRKKLPVILYVACGLAIFFMAFWFFLIYNNAPDSIYVFPENPKQGDTVFIRVKSGSDNITGSFRNEELVFYRRGKLQEWVAFLGIDVDQEAGDYKIYVSTGDTQVLTKEIKISSADFSSASAVSATSAKQTGITQLKAVDNIIKNDSPALKKVLKNFTKEPYFNSPFSFPLSKMEQRGYSFGKLISFAKYQLQHLGVDLKAPEKTEIYAVNEGKVVSILSLPNYGKTVIIDHGLDIFSLYLHLEEFKVSEGQMVKRGQLIGLSGDTGYTTAPHLHFSVRVGASRVDPIVFIETTKKLEDNFVLADISRSFLNIINKFK